MTHCQPTETVLTSQTNPSVRKIALAGQPNIGKTTIFNALTGLNQHVGNWPGKTVECKEGVFYFSDKKYKIIDLPGTYSLTANSPEELIAREYILTEDPDLVIAVVSAANLERSCYLLAELIGLSKPIIVALNMMDVAEKDHIHIDADILQKDIGLPIIPISATQKSDLNSLLQAVDVFFKEEDHPLVHISSIPENLQDDHQKILSLIQQFVPQPYPPEWIALKLLEADDVITKMMRVALPMENTAILSGILKNRSTSLIDIASARYEWIASVLRSAVTYQAANKPGFSEKIDRIAAHPILGFLTLGGILGLVFWLIFQIGAPIQEWLDLAVFTPFGNAATGWMAASPAWFRGLVVDGIIGGVGSVLTFLPILVIFFAAFGILEDIGYMARAAYVMDNLMQMMGLQGRSFLPLFLGFGCNVPAIMGTRVIDSKAARLLTIIIAPLIPCTARMAVVAFLTPAFFGKNSFLVTWGLVSLSIVLMVLMGIILNKVIFKGEKSSFIMELPTYHVPNLRTIGLLVWQRSLSFLQKAGTAILLISVLVWVFSVLPSGNLEDSYLAKLGIALSPVGNLMGFDWRLVVALLTSFMAKENAIATLGVLFGNSSDAGLTTAIAAAYTPASALSFLVVSLLFIPCAATIASIKQETNSWKWTAFTVAFYLALSVVMGILTYHIGTALGL